MTDETWKRVDDWIVETLLPPDAALTDALARNAAAGLPAHDVSPPQGKFLQLVARMIGARRILEIGTLGGYSTIWLARALTADGVVVSLEVDPGHAAVAAANLAAAGLAPRVDLRVGPAIDGLARLAAEKVPPFDLIFIDADKPNNPHYLEGALQLSRPGTAIVGDNVVRGGAVTDPDCPDPSVQGVRLFFDRLAAEPRLSATALQTVGAKGWDGFALALVE